MRRKAISLTLYFLFVFNSMLTQTTGYAEEQTASVETPVIRSQIQLKTQLAESLPGSYVVMAQGKIATFLHIYEKREQKVVIEEVSVPLAYFSRLHIGWKEWFASGAPGHTSWIMSEIDLERGVCEEVFSFVHQGWLDAAPSSSFLTTLLNLHFREIPEHKRRRIGPAPAFNKPDQRPIWHPRLKVEGRPVSQVPFFAYKAIWPADGTELARKRIEIYLPAVRENIWYPVYFPYWLEVEGKLGSARLRVIDAGMNARSPQKQFPRRILSSSYPAFLSCLEPPLLSKEGLLYILNHDLSSELDPMSFLLLADNKEGALGKLIPLSHRIERKDAESLTLLIPFTELEGLEGSLKEYHFTLSPAEDPCLTIDLPQMSAN